jgi:hypothetical protein
MVKQLFHGDADPTLLADADQRMAYTAPEAAYSMFLSLAGYDPSQSARRLSVPLRAINGDLYPTEVEGTKRMLRLEYSPDTRVRPLQPSLVNWHRYVSMCVTADAGAGLR